jgi:hypothetical protein
MKRNAKKLALALLVGAAFFIGTVELIAQSPQPSTSDKAQSPAATPNATAVPKSTPAASTAPSTTSNAPAQAAATTKPVAPPANAAGVVWINTDTGVYHKQGTRWYGKTKHGKYMLEADAIKAGYKPAK